MKNAYPRVLSAAGDGVGAEKGKFPRCEQQGVLLRERGDVAAHAFGQQLVRCKDGEADLATGTMFMGMLEDFRRKFPVLEDADDFSLKGI